MHDDLHLSTCTWAVNKFWRISSKEWRSRTCCCMHHLGAQSVNDHVQYLADTVTITKNHSQLLMSENSQVSNDYPADRFKLALLKLIPIFQHQQYWSSPWTPCCLSTITSVTTPDVVKKHVQYLVNSAMAQIMVKPRSCVCRTPPPKPSMFPYFMFQPVLLFKLRSIYTK